MEEELKKDHSDMQAVVDSKQKIIDAQVRRGLQRPLLHRRGVAALFETPQSSLASVSGVCGP